MIVYCRYTCLTESVHMHMCAHGSQKTVSTAIPKTAPMLLLVFLFHFVFVVIVWLVGVFVHMLVLFFVCLFGFREDLPLL